MLSEHQKKIFKSLPKEKREFIKKQLNSFDGWMNGDMFIPVDGICFYCKTDIINLEIKKGNNGSKGVTGCDNCFKSYCD